MRLFTIQSGLQSGAYNMALDETLLNWVRQETLPTLIIRTYQWEIPTLSLGVNQAIREVPALWRLYQKGVFPVQALVRRPTGGRAILHGQDISYALITNDPTILKQSLKESYALLSGWVQQSLQELGVPLRQSIEAQNKDYLRSAVCFETHTPSDLVSEAGDKISGAAQRRCAGGLLQHGAAFLQAYGLSEAALHNALVQATQAHFQITPELFPLAWVEASLAEMEATYLKASGEILASASVTNGSQFLPASC